MSQENQVMRLFREHLKKENSKLIERAVASDLKQDPQALLKLARLSDKTDPDVVYAQRENEQAYSDNFEKMLVDSVTRAKDKVEQTAAFSNLARHLAARYGSKAMDRAQQLLGGK
jgi:hypothetical protein